MRSGLWLVTFSIDQASKKNAKLSITSKLIDLDQRSVFTLTAMCPVDATSKRIWVDQPSPFAVHLIFSRLSMTIGNFVGLPVICSLALGWAIPASAQICGGSNSPCEVANGSYHLTLPDGAAPKGIVMHLHGGGGTGKGMLKSGLARESVSRGYVFVAPNGEHPEQRWKRDWSVRADAMRFNRSDTEFLKTVLSEVKGMTNLADAPVLLAGFSRGGSMVWNIACDVPDFANAYAPIAGAFWDTLPTSCAGPVRLFHTHGWNDRTVPLEGRSFGPIVQGDVWASLKVLRETNGCGKRQPEKSSFDGEFWLRHWTDCDAGEIELLLHKGGHGAPKGWASRIMDWFEAKRPGQP